MLFEMEDTSMRFSFELMDESKKLIIFEKEKISILDLTDENNVLAEISNSDLEVEEIYP